MARHYYSSISFAASLSAAVTAAQTTITTPESASDNGWPTLFPFTLALDYGLGNQELVDVTSKGTLTGGVRTWNVTRAVDGSTAAIHNAGAIVRHPVVGRDLEEAGAHLYASSGVHGVAGAVVGTTDAQTLSNKTLATPIIPAGGQVNIVGAIGTGVLRSEGSAGQSFTDTSAGDVTLKVSYGSTLKIGSAGPTGNQASSMSVDSGGVSFDKDLFTPGGLSYPRGRLAWTSVTTSVNTVAAGTERTIMWTNASGSTSQGTFEIVTGRLYKATWEGVIARSDSQSDLAIVKIRVGSNAIAGVVIYNQFLMLGASLVGDYFVITRYFVGAATSGGPTGTNTLPTVAATLTGALTVTLQKNSGSANTATMGMSSATFVVEDCGIA